MVMKYVFIAEAIINFASALVFLFTPQYHLSAVIESGVLTKIEELLCRWWAAMLIMQSSLLLVGAYQPAAREAIYWSLSIGELALIPVMVDYMGRAGTFFSTVQFTLTLATFLVLRLIYLLSPKKSISGLFDRLIYRSFGKMWSLIYCGVGYICGELNRESLESPDRIVTHTLGPDTKTCPYIAMVNGPDAKTLKTVISGRDPELRKTFKVFESMFGMEHNKTSITFLMDPVHGIEKRNKLKKFLSGSENMERIFENSVEFFRKKFDHWTEFESVHETMSRAIFELIGREVIGLAVIPEETAETFEELEDRIVFHSPPALWGIPLTPSQSKWVMTRRKYRKFTRRMIKANKDHIMKDGKYIWMLMEELASQLGGKPEDYIFSDDIASGVSLFLAMGNPIALLAFSLYVLSEPQNKPFFDACKEEMNRANPKDIVAGEKCPMTDSLYKELLRYISPANLMSRYTSRELKFGDKNIRKGSYMMVCLKTILHDELHWEHPERFNPARHFPSNFEYPLIPFSTGERICPGIQVTNAITKAFLYVLKDYRFVADAPLAGIPMNEPVTRLDKSYRGRFERLA